MHKEPKEYFLGNVDDQIFELEAELDDIETRIEDEGWEPDIDYRRQIDSLRLRLKRLKENIDDYEVVGDATWNDFKEHFKRTLDEVEKETERIIKSMDKILLE